MRTRIQSSVAALIAYLCRYVRLSKHQLHACQPRIPDNPAYGINFNHDGESPRMQRAD
jgi:hypothetical protein